MPTSPGKPAGDARFVPVFRGHALEHTGGYTQEEARAGGRDTVAGHPALRPHTPPRPSRTMAGYSTTTSPMSSLGILTNGKVTGDKVGPHGDLLAEFPYLGPPHNVLKQL